MAILVSHPINALGVLSVYGLHGPMQVVQPLRDQDEVDVIWHQTVRNYLDGKSFDVSSQQLQVRYLIATTEENSRAVIATLGNVMRHAGQNEAGTSWHSR